MHLRKEKNTKTNRLGCCLMKPICQCVSFADMKMARVANSIKKTLMSTFMWSMQKLEKYCHMMIQLFESKYTKYKYDLNKSLKHVTVTSE